MLCPSPALLALRSLGEGGSRIEGSFRAQRSGVEESIEKCHSALDAEFRCLAPSFTGVFLYSSIYCGVL